MNIQTATPAQIDARLAEINAQIARAESKVDYAKKDIEQRTKRGLSVLDFMEAKLADAEAELEAAQELPEPFTAEYRRRGGWTRYFMVMQANGHLHSSTQCSTCRWTTQFAWMTEFSGMSAEEIVDMAGEDACTVCFPDAPVEQRSRLPFRVAEREAADKARAERDAKKLKAAAEFIPYGRKGFKSLRAAENEAGRAIGYACSRRWQFTDDADHRAHLDRLAAEDAAEARSIIEAIVEARPGYDAEALIAKKLTKEAKELRKYNHFTVPAEPTL